MSGPLTLYALTSGARIPDMNADDVREVAGVIATYAGSLPWEDAVAHGLAAWRACRERRAIRERAADRRRELVRGLSGVVARGAGR